MRHASCCAAAQRPLAPAALGCCAQPVRGCLGAPCAHGERCNGPPALDVELGRATCRAAAVVARVLQANPASKPRERPGGLPPQAAVCVGVRKVGIGNGWRGMCRAAAPCCAAHLGCGAWCSVGSRPLRHQHRILSHPQQCRDLAARQTRALPLRSGWPGVGQRRLKGRGGGPSKRPTPRGSHFGPCPSRRQARVTSGHQRGARAWIQAVPHGCTQRTAIGSDRAGSAPSERAGILALGAPATVSARGRVLRR